MEISKSILPSATHKSTHAATYKSPGNIVLTRLPHLHQPKSFDPWGESLLQPRQFPLIPFGPKRKLRLEPRLAIGLGHSKEINIEKFLCPKPIVKTLAPRICVITQPPTSHKQRRPPTKTLLREMTKLAAAGERIPKQLVDDICDESRLTTTNVMMQEGNTIPIKPVTIPDSTWERNADVVSFHARVNEDEAGDWQTVAADWDAVQVRGPTQYPDTKRNAILRPSSLLHRRKTPVAREECSEALTTRMRDGTLHFIFDKPCPGYAGFRPRSPVAVGRQEEGTHCTTLSPASPCSYTSCTRLLNRRSSSHLASSMRQDFRPLPPSVYHVTPSHKRRAPMSRTVTLTYPYNPFNKVESRHEIEAEQ